MQKSGPIASSSRASLVSRVVNRRAKRWAVLAAAVAAAVPPQAVLAAITHRYSFTDGGSDGFTVTDSVGGANGTLIDRSANGGNPPQLFGGQVFFNNLGTSNNVAIGNYVDLPNNIAKTTNVTIEGWATWGGGNDWQRIFDIGNTNAAGTGERLPTDTTGGYNGRDYFFASPQVGRNGGAYGSELRIEPQNPNNTLAEQANTNFGANVEHHFALVIRGGTGGAITLFKDGVQVATNSTNLDPAQIDQVNTWIGRSNWSGDPFFNGSVNEFRIYDTAQTAQQIAASAGAGPDFLPGEPRTLVWNRPASAPNDYNTPGNFTPSGPPVGGDTVVFNNGGQAIVSTDTTAPVALLMQNGRIDVASGATYAVASADIAPGSAAGSAVRFDIGGTLSLPAVTVDGAATSTGTAPKTINFTGGGSAVLRASGSLDAPNVTLGLGGNGGTIETPAPFTLRAAVTGTGTLVKAGASQLTYIYPAGNTTDLTGGGRALIVNAGNLAVDTNGNNVTWTGAVGGPTDPTGIFFKQGAGTLTLQGAMAPKTNFHIRQGTVVLDGAAASVVSNGFVSVGLATGDNGSLTVQNGAKFTVNTQDFNVSDIAGTTGTLLVTGAGSVAQGPTVFVGKGGAGTTGTATVRNDGALTATGDLNVGFNTATGRLLVEGGTVSAGTLLVGRQGTAAGAVRQTGGTVQRGTGGREWRIGGGDSGADAAAVGTYDLSAGTLDAGGDNLQVGSFGVGQLNQTGGTVTLGSPFSSVGRFETGDGYLNVLGGSANNTNPDGLFLVGELGAAHMVVGRTGTFTLPAQKDMRLGAAAPGRGTVVLGTGSAGGTLTVGRVSRGDGTARFFFNGGTLVAGADSATFMENMTAAVVQAAGGTIDTNGRSITINQSLAAPTGSGLGSVTLAGGGTGYTAAPVVRITPAAGDTGVGATAVANLDANGVVTGITVTNPGTGYAAAPTITLLGGAPGTAAAVGTAALTAGPLASGGLTKTGAGTLTLGGTNTYTGTTTVSAGTLLVNGSLAGGASVAAGASIGGTGTIAGPVAVTSGTVSPGTSPGRMTVAGVTLAGGSASTLAIELAGPTVATEYDQLASTGAVSLGGATLAVTLLNGYVPAAGQQFTIVDNRSAGAIAGTFAGIPQGGQVVAGGVPFTVSYVGGTGNDVVLTSAVPEPATIGLFGLAAVGLLARRRRQSGGGTA